MKRLVLIAAAVALLSSAAPAALCGKCRGKMFISSIGKCTLCTNHTGSGAHKLCRKCSAKRKQCEHCRGPLGAVGPVRPGPPVKPGPGIKPSPTPRDALVLDEAANGETVRLRLGARFYVKLKVDPLLRWGMEPPAGEAVAAEGRPRHLPLLGPDGRSSPTFAPAGHMLYTFKAVQLGSATLKFKLLARPGRPVRRQKTFTVTMEVTKGGPAPKPKPPRKVFPYVRSQDGPGFGSLFDGKTLKGWKAADMSWWSVEDGAITGKITKRKPCRKNQYLFSQVGRMKDFELKLGHRIVSPHRVNCGFQYRSEHYKQADCKGYQVDNNTGTAWLVRLYDEFGRHTLAWRGQRTVFDADGKKTSTDIPLAKGKPHFDLAQWHEYHLICKGTRLTLKVNGKLVAEVIDSDPKQQDLSGLLALQLHSGPPMTVQFKDIRYKPLGPQSPPEK